MHHKCALHRIPAYTGSQPTFLYTSPCPQALTRPTPHHIGMYHPTAPPGLCPPGLAPAPTWPMHPPGLCSPAWPRPPPGRP